VHARIAGTYTMKQSTPKCIKHKLWIDRLTEGLIGVKQDNRLLDTLVFTIAFVQHLWSCFIYKCVRLGGNDGSEIFIYVRKTNSLGVGGNDQRTSPKIT
jgi:hypothetical protein